MNPPDSTNVAHDPLVVTKFLMIWWVVIAFLLAGLGGIWQWWEARPLLSLAIALIHGGVLMGLYFVNRNYRAVADGWSLEILTLYFTHRWVGLTFFLVPTSALGDYFARVHGPWDVLTGLQAPFAWLALKRRSYSYPLFFHAFGLLDFLVGPAYFLLAFLGAFGDSTQPIALVQFPLCLIFMAGAPIGIALHTFCIFRLWRLRRGSSQGA